MKKGEKAAFIIKPEYAYEAKGKPELGIPANTTLIYEAELVECFLKTR